MATVESTCEECEGRRFQASVLEYTLGGRNIAEVLAMSVTEARGVLRRRRGGDAGRAQGPRPAGRRRARLPHPRPAADHAVRRRAAAAQAGHPDGGEGRRLRPRRADHRPAPRRRREPARRCSTGWSTPASRSIVIEHHQAVMAHADWIIDLGPGAGHDGGRIVFEGTPADLVAEAEDPHRRAPRGVRRRLTRRPPS